jgi:hypothetical protein
VQPTVPDAGPPAVLDEPDREAPPAVVTAVAIGTAPLPIVAVYAILFLVHGSVHPVQPPDVTSSKQGEFLAGWVALATFVVLTLGLLWFLNGRRRWLFAVLELAMLGVCITFASDDTVSGRTVSVLIAIASTIALVCAFLPQSWEYMRQREPRWLTTFWQRVLPRRRAAASGTAVAGSAEPTPVQSGMLRRRRTRER